MAAGLVSHAGGEVSTGARLSPVCSATRRAPRTRPLRPFSAHHQVSRGETKAGAASGDVAENYRTNSAPSAEGSVSGGAGTITKRTGRPPVGLRPRGPSPARRPNYQTNSARSPRRRQNRSPAGAGGRTSPGAAASDIGARIIPQTTAGACVADRPGSPVRAREAVFRCRGWRPASNVAPHMALNLRPFLRVVAHLRCSNVFEFTRRAIFQRSRVFQRSSAMRYLLPSAILSCCAFGVVQTMPCAASPGNPEGAGQSRARCHRPGGRIGREHL